MTLSDEAQAIRDANPDENGPVFKIDRSNEVIRKLTELKERVTA